MQSYLHAYNICMHAFIPTSMHIYISMYENSKYSLKANNARKRVALGGLEPSPLAIRAYIIHTWRLKHA